MIQLLPLLLAPLAAPPAAPQGEPIYLLRPDAVILPDGTRSDGAVVLVRGDKILAAGTQVAAPSSAREVRLRGVLAPGLFDAATRAGTEHGLSEASSFLTPELLAVDALDPDAKVWQERLAAGVTACQLVPAVLDTAGDPIRVLAGWSGVALAGGEARILETRGRQTVGLLSGPFQSAQGGPSSLAGAVEALGAALAADPALVGPRVLVAVDSAEGIAAARAALPERDVAWLAEGDPAAFGRALAGQLLILPVVDDGLWSARLAETWKRLHAAGVRVAFGGGDDGAAALRTTAMAFARATGDSAAAMAAITRNGADAAGLGTGFGRIAPGARADLVLWSAHPLDAAARVRAVMIAGRTVWSATPPEEFE